MQSQSLAPSAESRGPHLKPILVMNKWIFEIIKSNARGIAFAGDIYPDFPNACKF